MRLMIGFGILILLLAGSGAYTLYNLNMLNKKEVSLSISATDITSSSILANIASQGEMTSFKWVYPVLSENSAIEAYLATDDRAEQKRLWVNFNKYSDEIVSIGQQLGAQVNSDEGSRQVAVIQKTQADVKKSAENVIKAYKAAGATAAQTKRQLAGFKGKIATLRGDIEAFQKVMRGQFKQHDDKRQSGLNTMDKDIDNSVGIIDEAFHSNIALVSGCIALALVITFMIYRSIVTPLNRATQLAHRIAKYDLVSAGDEQVLHNGKDELSLLLRDIYGMRESLQELVKKIIHLTGNLSTSISEFMENAKNINKIGDDQLSYTTRSAAATEEMASSVKEVAGSAADAAKYATEADQNARSSVEKEAAATLTEMNKAKKEVEETSNKMQRLSASAEEVGEIVTVINGVAEQTNLLALNAAIEAARAGEQGRGFAVVADEVRNLAERTTQATKEIAEKIVRIQAETKDAISNMDVSKESVERGAEVVNGIINSLQEIQQINQRLKNLNDNVATATEQQSSAAEEISKNIHEVQQSAEVLSGHAQRIDEQANGLAGMVSDLNSAVGMFKIQ
ncbi:MAG TPA: HAMP domain-containing methyl-accepting chemotaxis protein [Gammaproteobacteria bacterium]|nr:HAMP domain-containing methyl-accepting chemotaxis protein [Gammaproteobacteria bacterium]